MTKEEFEAADLPGKDGLYTLVRRDAAGELVVVPYHEECAEELGRAAGLLREAAKVATDEASALPRAARRRAAQRRLPAQRHGLDGHEGQPIDVVIGPIESYEDRCSATKAAFEAFVLVKDVEWSERLAKFAQHLPALQRGCRWPDEYKAESPGSDADLNAYDAIYYAGDANAGAKTIAINLPNDEQVQLAKGSRRLQLKNAMRAKFDAILVPIAGELIAEEQRGHITFDAFFENVMFHEVAHGLGIKNTLDGEGTVREALLELAGALEEGKADVLGLYMIGQLVRQMGELDAAKLEDNYVTFLAGIFRSVRFGASSAHGQANMPRSTSCRSRAPSPATPRTAATASTSTGCAGGGRAGRRILTLQGDGDHASFRKELARVRVLLRAQRDRRIDARCPHGRRDAAGDPRNEDDERGSEEGRHVSGRHLEQQRLDVARQDKRCGRASDRADGVPPMCWS
jgi:hypothetical protein